MAFSGKNARVRLTPVLPAPGAATFITGVKWTANLRADELDVTTFNSGGRGDYKAGVHDMDVSLEGTWENNIHANPPSIMEGHTYSLEIWPDFVNLPALQFAATDFMVFDVSVDAEVRGIVKYSISGKARASVSFTAPGPITPSATAQA